MPSWGQPEPLQGGRILKHVELHETVGPSTRSKPRGGVSSNSDHIYAFMQTAEAVRVHQRGAARRLANRKGARDAVRGDVNSSEIAWSLRQRVRPECDMIG